LSYAGCPALTDADFGVDTLAINAKNSTLEEPLKMAFDMDGQGNVDVYFVQRKGLVRKYVAATKAVVDLEQYLLTGPFLRVIAMA